jgi:hypothetical protein
MKYIITIICSIILPILSLKEMKPKLCINCKHFITDGKDGLFGKCSLFPLEDNKSYFLVNGINPYEYEYCSISRKRNDMCGTEGKMYEKKKKIGIKYKKKDLDFF